MSNDFEADAEANASWAMIEIGKLRQHISELEKSLEATRKERDVAQAMLAEREGLIAGLREREATYEAAVKQAFADEVDRLKPSGQVAEMVIAVERAMQPDEDVAGEDMEQGESALSHLAAKAQGYDAAVTDNAAFKTAFDALDYAYAPGGDNEQRAKAWRTFTKQMQSPHPGTALLEEHRKEIDKWAENVATLRAERDTERQLRLEAAEQHNQAVSILALARDMSLAMHEAAQKARLGEEAAHREALVRARNEGVEKAAAWHDGQAASQGYSPLSTAPFHRRYAETIRAMKEPEE